MGSLVHVRSRSEFNDTTGACGQRLRLQSPAGRPLSRSLLPWAPLRPFIAQSDSDRFILEDGRAADRVIIVDAHGWLLVALGAALVIAALAMSWSAERTVVDKTAV